MVDVVDRATRSRMMSGIRGRDTQPEILVRKYLHAQGLRYRLARKDLPGKPDLVFPGYRAVVFVHGCFWHRHPECKYAATPSSNRDFWREKFATNVERDRRAEQKLRENGWRVFVVWECAISGDTLRLLKASIVEEFVSA